MSSLILPRVAALVLGAVLMAAPAFADGLKDEIAPTGKLRVAIAISSAGGAFWCNKTESGSYTGVPVDLGKEMAAQLGVPVEYVAYHNSGQITDAAASGVWDVTFLPQDAGKDDQDGVRTDLSGHGCDLHRQGGLADHRFRLARPARRQGRRRYNTTTMRGAVAHLKNAKVIEYQTFDEIFPCSRTAKSTLLRCRANYLTTWRRRFRARKCWTRRSRRR